MFRNGKTGRIISEGIIFFGFSYCYFSMHKMRWYITGAGFYGLGPYHIETSPLICSANQCTGFYMAETSVMKELTLWFLK